MPMPERRWRPRRGISESRPALLAVDEIIVPPDRLRQLRPEKVAEMAESISNQGLLQPIVVRRTSDGLTLVAGWRQLEATRLLGHKNIRASVRDMNADQARLVEIDENLARAELSPAERAMHVGLRKELYEKLHPETKHGAAGKHRKKSQIAISEKPAPAFIESTPGKSRTVVAREILLIGTLGNIPAPSPGEQPPQLIAAPRGRHSEKPAIFAEHIERLYPNVPKLEMFARVARPGWDAWGNEVATPEAAA